MMSAEQNEFITRIGAGTPAGQLMRHYWQPAALVDELQGERPLKRVRLLGEDLVLFRDDEGRYGLLDRHCAHRGADLSFGRLEDGGVRCPFHGWLYDVEGKCLETPAEPEGSLLCRRVHQPAYPVVERNGILFAYLGAGAPPAFPDFDCFVAPGSHTFAFKGFIECNWLQALEVGIDPVHASYLHRFFADEDPKASYGRPFRGISDGSELPITQLLREHTRPRIELEPTPWGFRIVTLREIDAARTHMRVTNLLFPHAFAIPLDDAMTITQWHVPVDDEHCYWYAIFTSFAGAVDKEAMRRQRLQLYALPDYKPRRNKANDWGYDPGEQREATYTGLGADINVHDQWAIESMGPIQDRTREHLGSTDKVISAYRRVLVRAIEQARAGERPPMVLDEAEARRLTGPAAFDAIGPTADWQGYWQQLDAERRRSCGWTTKAA
jgi:nitrite reductase/ring-hydroxylating ferredoxin subunit